MNLATRRYSVQSVDFYGLPLSFDQIRNYQSQFVGLFCEWDPAERARSFATLEEEIDAHDRDFK